MNNKKYKLIALLFAIAFLILIGICLIITFNIKELKQITDTEELLINNPKFILVLVFVGLELLMFIVIGFISGADTLFEYTYWKYDIDNETEYKTIGFKIKACEEDADAIDLITNYINEHKHIIVTPIQKCSFDDLEYATETHIQKGNKIK